MDFSPAVYGAVLGFLLANSGDFRTSLEYYPSWIMQLSQNGWSQNVSRRLWRESFGQTAVVLAMYFKFKDQKMKAICIPAVISGIVGITEPAIYGITLPRKKTFIFT